LSKEKRTRNITGRVWYEKPNGAAQKCVAGKKAEKSRLLGKSLGKVAAEPRTRKRER